MGNGRILRDTVTIFNYVGESNDVATYQQTVFTRCYCPVKYGVVPSQKAKRPSNSGTLYVFDNRSVARSTGGAPRTYLPYDLWKLSRNKSDFWTICDDGKDYFVKAGSSTKLQITSFSHKEAGSKRMSHFEIEGK